MSSSSLLSGEIPAPLEPNSLPHHSRRGLEALLLRLLTQQDLYPGLTDEQAMAQRVKTRQSIIDEMELRVDEDLALIKGVDAEQSKLIVSGRPLFEGEDEGTQPNYGTEFRLMDPELVTWDGEDDVQHPRNWPMRRKVVATVIVSLYTLISPFALTVLLPAVLAILEDFGITNITVKLLIVLIFLVGWVIGPLVVAPISELYGRQWVLTLLLWFLVAFTIGCAFAQNTAQILVFRVLAGFSGAAPLSVGAGVLGDLFNNDERNLAMAFYGLGPTLGPTIAPVMSGFIVENAGWRWVFRVLVIFAGLLATIGTFFFEETYLPVLLKRKAARMRKESGNPNLKCLYEIADGETVAGRFYVNLLRPLQLLLFHPMVLGLGIFMAFVYGFYYLMVVSFPSVWGEVYGFNLGITGLMYIPMGIGYGLGIPFWTFLINRDYRRRVANNGGVLKPEFRLPYLLASGILMPVALVWYGWLAQKHLHWMMPAVGTAIYSFGLIAVFQTIQNYLIDMSPMFAALSVGAASMFRLAFGFGFPLFGHALYERLNYGWGNTLCAFLAFGLGVPFPVFVMLKGEGLRNWANRRFERQLLERRKYNLARLRKQQAEQAEKAVKA